MLPTRKKILFTPLDWGLGHATRCVPVIRELEKQGAEVILAAGGRPFYFFQKEFPHLELLPFPGYGITYPKNAALGFHLLLRSPKIAAAVRREKKEIEKMARCHNIDCIISDNRFACRTDFTRNIFITHQLRVKAPFAGNIVSKIHRSYYEKFDEVWVPDAEDENQNLSGELSHGVNTKAAVHFIGPLTRFSGNKEKVQKNKIVVLLSGPEPQRSIFEEMILAQAKKIPAEEFSIVRGITEEEGTEKQVAPNVTMVNHLASEDLAHLLAQAKAVVSRSGYSTLCDLSAFDVPAIVVSTPGQTEQEYLAQYHAAKGNVIALQQDAFDLAKAIGRISEVKPLNIQRDEKLLEERVKQLLTAETQRRGGVTA